MKKKYIDFTGWSSELVIPCYDSREPQEILVADIDDEAIGNLRCDRRPNDSKALQQSLKERGQLLPLSVIPGGLFKGCTKPWALMAGVRRVAAMKQIDMRTALARCYVEVNTFHVSHLGNQEIEASPETFLDYFAT